jgi:hypothetical protein
VSRLSFLARTRELDLGLDDVRDLFAVWDGGTCGAARARLQDVVTSKVTGLDARIAELSALRAELELARQSLRDDDSGGADGGCGAGCPCMTATDLADRRGAWQATLARAHSHSRTAGGARVVLPAEPTLTARVAELVALEQQCCSFITVTMTVRAPEQLLLEATAPEHARPLVEDPLGVPA